MGPETIITKQITDWLNKQPRTMAIKIHATAMQGRGIPDILACHNGHLLAIEVKRPQLGRITQIQKYTLQKWEQAGATSLIATSLLDIQKHINKGQTHATNPTNPTSRRQKTARRTPSKPIEDL